MRTLASLIVLILLNAPIALAESFKLNCHVQGEGVQDGIKTGSYSADKIVILNNSEAHDQDDKGFAFNNCKWSNDGALCVKETQAMVKQFSSFLYNVKTGGAWYLNIVTIGQKSTGNSWIGNCNPIPTGRTQS